jgi:hypothetical protein
MASSVDGSKALHRDQLILEPATQPRKTPSRSQSSSMGALGFDAAEGAAIPGSMTGGAKPLPCPLLPTAAEGAI